MKKKEFWDYEKTISKKASGHSLGSRLIRILLVGGCFAASATILFSLFFYFFPAQAIHSAREVQAFTRNIIKTLKSSDKPPDGAPISWRSQRAVIGSQVSLLHMETALASGTLTAKEAADAALASEASSNSVEPEVPLITFSSALGDVNNIGQSNEDLLLDESYLAMVDSSMGPMLYYNQGDSRWEDYLYGGTDTMSQYGCGPTVVAMLINAFTEYTVIPPNMADWAVVNGYHSPHNGSRHSIIPGALSAYGLQVESVAETDSTTVANLLRSGHVLVALMGRGTFSNDGHFIIITNILDNGNVRIADSYNFENTKMEWDLELLLAELKHSGSDGGPLWSVSYPETN